MKYLLIAVVAVALLGNSPIRSIPSLGKAEATCRSGEAGPALLIRAIGLKDRRGILRAELYPANETDFLADDNILVQQGKTFRRVDLAIPAGGDPVLCMRIPGAGRYALSLLHDRDRNLKFGVFSDGIGFSSNPKLGRSKPSVALVAFNAGQGLSRIDVTLNYFSGFSMRPIRK